MRLLARLARDEAGNALMIIVASLLPLLAMVGGGLDIGRGYLVQARLQQACDAGVLAARKRLGTETVVSGEIPAATAEIGDRFFMTNFVDAAYGTTTRTFEMTLEEDFSITGYAEARMPTTIMGIFGQEFIDVSADCGAKLNYANTDIMMVLDTTGSMGRTNPGDTSSRIEVLQDVIRSFHTQLSATAMAGSRIRMGFVPYSTNVNVGHLLEDDWVTTEWAYQSRKLKQAGGSGTTSFQTEPTQVSGSATETNHDTYSATYDGSSYSCPTRPGDAVAQTLELVNEYSQLVLTPLPGTRTTKTYERTRNGEAYRVTLDGNTCTVTEIAYDDYVDTYDYVTEPSSTSSDTWVYSRIVYDVSDWRSSSNGCIEERQTYEIDDYDNVDFSRALDLNLDLVPTENPASAGVTVLEDLVGTPLAAIGLGTPTTMELANATKWRPMFPEIIYAREKKWDDTGSFNTARVQSDEDFISPAVMATAACPPPAMQLAALSSTELDNYLDLLVPDGNTYHDIGMIWGGRLMSPTGLFAAHNADVAGSPTNRNLIFLTDGETAPRDISYSTYGLEPIDQRRWSPSSSLTLTQTVEKRFQVACSEVRKRGITVWVIGFGTSLNQIMKDCAGKGHFFEAADAAELNASFAAIAKSVSELRIVD